MSKEIPQFGEKIEETEYTPRPGVYAIIFDNKERLAVVGVKERYFLIGGGLDNGESEVEGLRREVMEEIGKKVSSSIFLGKAHEYVNAPDGYFYKMMSFYKVELSQDEKSESDPTHKFLWVTKDEFRSRARHPAQVYAVEHLYI